MEVVITGAAVDQDTIITVADLKAHLRVTHSAEDGLIGAMRSAAIAHVENHCNIKLGSYTAKAYSPGFYPSYFSKGPVTAVSEVRYQTTATKTYSSLTVLSAANWFTDLISSPARIAYRDFPIPYEYAFQPVVASCTVGYTTIPAPIVHAIKLYVAHKFENRQEEITGTISTRLKMGMDALLNPYRVIFQP